jgi:hypothetical protein
VFGNYAVVGGVRETWIAVCYVLIADFGDLLPHDKDQMPVNGNPHPLPGQLQLDFHNFVIPQYPEIGWNNVPLQPNLPEVGDADFFQPENNQENIPHGDHHDDIEEEVDQQIDDSIILDGSDSEGSVNAGPVNHNVVVNHVQVVPYWDCSLESFASLSFSKQWDMFMQELYPKVCFDSIPLPLFGSPSFNLLLAKGPWAANLQQGCHESHLSTQNTSFIPFHRKVARTLVFSKQGDNDLEVLLPLFSAPLQFLQGKGKVENETCLALSLGSPGVQLKNMVLASPNLHCCQQGKNARPRQRQKEKRRPYFLLKLLTLH